MDKLFTVIILHYKQPEYYTTAVESVLQQDYSNIELIFADDCSGNLNENDVREYVENNKKDSLKNVIYQFNSVNIGTIKNINQAIKKASGEYILIFAADDKLYSKDVLRSLADAYVEAPKETVLLTGQSVMMDENLDKEIENFVPADIVKNCNGMTSDEQHTALLYQSDFAVGATAFRKQCFEKYGLFDEKLKVIEDWSYFLDFTQNGGKVYYTNVNCLMHRAGGISEDGKNRVLSTIYYDDLNQIYEKRVLPFVKNEKNKILRCRIILHYKDISRNKLNVFKYMLLNSDAFIYYVLKKILGKKNEK